MAKNSACNLGSINLLPFVKSPFTEHAKFDWSGFKEAIYIAIEALDEVLDENLENHALDEQREMSRKYRNVGLGIMGFADALIALGIRYGSNSSISFTYTLMNYMLYYAIEKSQEIAKYKDPFPAYNDNLFKSDIIAKLRESYSIADAPLRNCSLLSIAPTGSIGTMLGISGGIEPEFALSFYRTTKSLNGEEDKVYKVDIPIVKSYKEVTGNTELPNYFITSEQISWKERIDVQAAAQWFCDTAISSTINLPEDIALEGIEKLYLYAWKMGLKGITIFRSGCKRLAILSTTNTQAKESTIEYHSAPKRPKVLDADYYEIKVKGENFIIIVGLYDNKPYEIFALPNLFEGTNGNLKGTLTKNKKKSYTFKSDKIEIANVAYEGEDEKDFVTICLMTSQLLRHGVQIEHIIHTLKKTNAYMGTFVNAIIRVLYKYKTSSEKELCPECNQEIRHDGGCVVCPSCGWSKCMIIRSLTNTY